MGVQNYEAMCSGLIVYIWFNEPEKLLTCSKFQFSLYAVF
jgi:hypothetical protein